MKICITSTGENLDSAVEPRFGRCAYFIIVDPDDLKFKAIANPNVSAVGGAGIQSAQLIANEGVEAVITGNVGPNAFQALSSAKIKMFKVAGVTVKEAVQKYKEGKLKELAGHSAPGRPA
jgi:predicted Fe-Mo cluster-binding NifX family protein